MNALLLTVMLSAVTYPGATWQSCEPEAVGVSRTKLATLAELVGGRGCVVRHGCMAYTWGDASRSGDVASAVKPVISTLLLFAVQEGKLPSVDDKVAEFEPRLRTLNDGKDATMTWRHLASQMSGYGLAEAPGNAYSYNDFALALYYDTLTQKVFQQDGTAVLKTRLADALQFEDRFSFEAFGQRDRAGRLAISPRDFARFGLFILHGGQWGDRQLLKPELITMATSSPIPADTSLTSGKDAAMLPNQRSLGGGKNITPVGPGFYSFNWWLNRTDRTGRRLYVDAPPDTFVASGHGGKRTLWIIPSLDLIVSWNDSPISDHDGSPGNADTKCNRAARLMKEGVTDAPATRLDIEGTRFRLNGEPTFLLGMSYYGALGASDEFLRLDLDDMQRHGFNWIRVWATWGAFGNDVSAVTPDGQPREPFLGKLSQLVAECDRRGMVVDVTLSRGNGVTGPVRLQTLEAHRRAMETLVTALKPYRNWYLDLSNERNIRDKRYTSIADLKDLRALVRRLDPDRLVTASHAGDISPDELRDYLMTAPVDFISPHRPRNLQSPQQTTAKTREYLGSMREMGRVVPVHYQEQFRRGFAPQRWEPPSAAFLTDLEQARSGGAAGWCFHNGDQKDQQDGQPRRSFDLRERRLFEQFDDVERGVLSAVRAGGDPK